MSGFFKISLQSLEDKHVATINWLDYKHKEVDSKAINNASAFRAYVLSELPHVLKSILKRYAKHRVEDLKGSELENKANDFYTYCKELNRRKSLGDVCSFINRHKHRIDAIKPPSSEGWSDVIEGVLNYASTYIPLSTDKELQSIINSHFNTISHDGTN